MPRFLVNLASTRNQVFELRPGEHLVGREKDAALQLPNPSVSRHHAKIVVDATGVSVQDLESGNGTMVNGKPVTSQRLASRDEVRIGKYTLVFLTDTKADEFYRGRCVKYMPAYEPKVGGDTPSIETYVLSKDAMKALQAQGRLVEDARVVLVRDPNHFWYPEDKKLTFGGTGAQIHPQGWYVWGDVAEIAWDGQRHVLKKLAFWVPVVVNDKPVADPRPLRPGDNVRIAGSTFRYEVDE